MEEPASSYESDDEYKGGSTTKKVTSKTKTRTRGSRCKEMGGLRRVAEAIGAFFDSPLDGIFVLDKEGPLVDFFYVRDTKEASKAKRKKFYRIIQFMDSLYSFWDSLLASNSEGESDEAMKEKIKHIQAELQKCDWDIVCFDISKDGKTPFYRRGNEEWDEGYVKMRVRENHNPPHWLRRRWFSNPGEPTYEEEEDIKEKHLLSLWKKFPSLAHHLTDALYKKLEEHKAAAEKAKEARQREAAAADYTLATRIAAQLSRQMTGGGQFYMPPFAPPIPQYLPNIAPMQYPAAFYGPNLLAGAIPYGYYPYPFPMATAAVSQPLPPNSGLQQNVNLLSPVVPQVKIPTVNKPVTPNSSPNISAATSLVELGSLLNQSQTAAGAATTATAAAIPTDTTITATTPTTTMATTTATTTVMTPTTSHSDDSGNDSNNSSIQPASADPKPSSEESPEGEPTPEPTAKRRKIEESHDDETV